MSVGLYAWSPYYGLNRYPFAGRVKYNLSIDLGWYPDGDEKGLLPD